MGHREAGTLTRRVLTGILAVLAILFLAWIVVGWPAAMWGPGAAGIYGLHPLGRWMMGYGRFGGAGGAWALGFMFVCWALVVAGAYLLIRWLIRQGRVTTGTMPIDQALVTLRERYARGELSDEDYDRMRSRLEGGDKR